MIFYCFLILLFVNLIIIEISLQFLSNKITHFFIIYYAFSENFAR